jgi:pyruvate,orthophosphate dikinase
MTVYKFGYVTLSKTPRWPIMGGPFVRAYRAKRILPNEPLQTIDKPGVGELMKMAIRKGRKKRPGLKIGICGEHGRDPQSVFCHQIGLDYVSCSPFRVPIAMLAAALAVIQQMHGSK